MLIVLDLIPKLCEAHILTKEVQNETRKQDSWHSCRIPTHGKQ